MFPEDRKLALGAHDAGVDVIMAYRLALAYLLQALDMPLPGKIDSFFTSTADSSLSGWKIDDEKTNALLKRLQEAGSSMIMSRVASDDAEVMSDDEEEEEEQMSDTNDIMSDDEEEEEHMSDVNDVMSDDEEDEDAQVMGDV